MSFCAFVRGRGRPKPDPDQKNKYSSTPVRQTRDTKYKSSLIGTTSSGNKAGASQHQDLEEVDSEDEGKGQAQDNTSSTHRRIKVARRAIKNTDASQREDEGNDSSLYRYPLTQKVLNLEKREQEEKRKCRALNKKCQELSLAMDNMREEIERERSECKAIYQKLEEAMNRAMTQLEDERGKSKELSMRSESLVADLAAASEENTLLTKMLEEKTWESRVFRCAYTAVFKLCPSISDRIDLRNVLARTILLYRAKAQQERENQGNQGQDESASNETSEPLSQQESPTSVSDAAESDLDSEDLPLSRKRSRTAQDEQSSHGDQASDKDTDEDMPLSFVRRKRAKTVKAAPLSDEESSLYA
ncbi:hypothetical protein TARUN_6696 [Trichoderma arundinaceum]|uniref:Uncharacterized protein n=1 Tax=Trichoderma arundinaceum TaxID=490622 RepID=A0A395NID5_TRIAR|nr:hypothetical protein TARUN_6696 [Trichoderma arundinaceum]